jgi:DNA-directed RNA polymerase beta subunit
MITINLNDPKIKENIKTINALKAMGIYTDEEIQEMYDKQVEADLRSLHETEKNFGGSKMREKLIEIIRKARKKTKEAKCDFEREHIFADELIANGVIVPPCKVGDKVYVVDVCAKEVIERKIMEIRQTEGGMIYIHSCGFDYTATSNGKTFFLSREDAEKALKGVE